MREMPADFLTSQVDTRVEPGLGEHRWHGRCSLHVGADREVIALAENGEVLGVPLLHHPEPAELSLLTIEVPFVIRVPRDETVSTDAVERLYPINDVHRERQARDPR